MSSMGDESIGSFWERSGISIGSDILFWDFASLAFLVLLDQARKGISVTFHDG